MEGSEWVALAAVIVAGISIVVTYLGSGKRLEHEAKMQQIELAEDRRSEGLDAAVRAYTLVAKVVEQTYFHSIKGWAEAGVYGMDAEVDATVQEALGALEMVRVVGWKTVRDPANELWMAVVYMEVTATSATGDLQVQEPDSAEVKTDVEKVHGLLSKSLDKYREAINK